MDNVINKDDAQFTMEDWSAGRQEASSEAPSRVAPAACQSPVRLRTPERRQMEMVPRCLDDLVPPLHPVRQIAEVVEHLDLSAFCRPIKAREGVAGRDATDPKLLVALWLYACVRGIGSAHELARQCQESRAFLWLLGGVTVNHRWLSDFRTDHGPALDQLFTQVIASLVDQGVVKVSRISQDGVRVRVGAGASSFRREEKLENLLEEAQQHVRELREELDSPAVRAKLTARQRAARQRAARQRAARDKQERTERAIAQLPEMKRRQEKAAQRAGEGKRGEKIREKQPRVSTTDAEARVMKMSNGGFNPAVNVQLATDAGSQAIVGVEVSNQGSDAGLSAPLRQQVEERTGGKVEEHLMDGGYLKTEDLDEAQAQGVAVYVPPKSARNPQRRGQELQPQPGDSEAVRAWKQRMSSAEGKQIYQQRAATSERVNADLRSFRGLGRILVRGLAKARCIALWCALAYNVMYFAKYLVGSKG